MKKRNKRSTLRFLSVLLSLCLLLAMTPAVSAQTNETTTPETTTSSSGYTMEDLLAGLITPYELFEKPDPSVIPDAVGTDQAYARAHIERMYSEENGLDTVIFKNPDQSRTVYLFDYPVKYRDAHGITKDISLTVQNHPTQTGAYQSAPGTVQTNFSKNVTDGIALQHEEISVKLIPVLPTPELQPGETMQMTANAVAQLKDSKTVSYAYDAKTTIEYSPTYTGFKEDIVVQEYTGQTEYHFLLQTNGLTLQKINESYFLTDSEGNIKATLGDIIIFTADEKNNTMGGMTHETLRENQLYGLTIHVDAEYLQDENTAYPIRIDPTLEINYDNNGTGAIEDATLNSDGVTTGGSGSIYVGNRSSYGLARVLMKFPGLTNYASYISESCQIINAEVQIRDMLCQADEMQVNCHIFSGNTWSESSVNWSNANPNVYGYLLSSQTVSYAIGAAKANPHRYAFDITLALKIWYSGNGDFNKGIIFKTTDAIENGSTYISKTFASYNRASYKPFLSVTYTGLSRPFADGRYYIKNKRSGKYLTCQEADVYGNAYQMTFDGNTDQQWRFTYLNNGYYSISCGEDEYYALSIEGNAYMNNETNVSLFFNSGTTGNTVGSYAQWYVVSNGDGSYRIASQCSYETRVLTVIGASMENAANVFQYQYNASHNDEWYIEPCVDKLSSTRTFSAFDFGNGTEYDEVSLFAQNMRNLGYYEVGTFLTTDKVLDPTKVKEIGQFSDIVYLNGHGDRTAALVIQNATGSWVDGLSADSTILDYYYDNVSCSDSIGATLDPARANVTNSFWNQKTKWVIMGQCSQMNYGAVSGTPITDNPNLGNYWNGLNNSQIWARTMLGSDHRMHGYLGYYESAPEAEVHYSILQDFFENLNLTLNGTHIHNFVSAWDEANSGFLGFGDANWGAIYHSANANDNITAFTPSTTPGSDYTIYLLRHDFIDIPVDISLESTVNNRAYYTMNNGSQKINTNLSLQLIPKTLSVAQKTTVKNYLETQLAQTGNLTFNTDGSVSYKRVAKDWGERNLAYNKTAVEAINLAKQHLNAMGLLPKGNYRTAVSGVTRREMDLGDGKQVDDTPEVVEYTVHFYHQLNGVDVLSDQGEGITVTVDKYGVADMKYRWSDIKTATKMSATTAQALSLNAAREQYLQAKSEDTVQDSSNGSVVVTQAYYVNDGNTTSLWTFSDSATYLNPVLIDAEKGNTGYELSDD